MKKFMTIMLALSFLSAATVAFGKDDTTTTKAKKKSGKKKKSTEATTKS